MISWIIDTLPNGLIVKYSSDIFEGRRPNLTASLRVVVSKIFSLLSAGFIIGALVILGLVLFIVPGIIAAVSFSLTIQVIIIERSGVFESLRRSRKLVSREWWQAFSVLAFTFLLTAIAGVIGDIVLSLPLIVGDRFELLIASIIVSAAKPLQPVALTYLYYSLSAGQKILEAQKQYQLAFLSPLQMREKTQRPAEFNLNFCFKCGQRLPPDAVYCPRCGIRVRIERL